MHYEPLVTVIMVALLIMIGLVAIRYLFPQPARSRSSTPRVNRPRLKTKLPARF